MSDVPEMVFAWRDAPTDTRGFLVVDRLRSGVAAGGIRVHPAVDVAMCTALARNMTAKQAAVGLKIGGAKAGLAMKPDHPERKSILARFIARLRPLLFDCYSAGPDVNTTMPELEAIARDAGVPSLKIALARNLGIDDDVFLSRYALFESEARGASVNQLRGPIAVSTSVQALLAKVGGDRVCVQGAGSMGGGVAHLLHRAGVRVVAWADDEKCIVREGGIDVAALFKSRASGRVPADAARATGAEVKPREAVLSQPCDVIVLAAISNACNVEQSRALPCRGVVEAANLALGEDVERDLHARGVLVVPDLLASAGGSLAVEALYTGEPKSGDAILAHVEKRVATLAAELLDECAKKSVTPREVLRARADAALA